VARRKESYDVVEWKHKEAESVAPTREETKRTHHIKQRVIRREGNEVVAVAGSPV